MSTQMIMINDEPETKEQKRKRLASELRFVAEQWNSKVLELVDGGMTVSVKLPDNHNRRNVVCNEAAVINHCKISYQTAPKTY